MNFEHLISFIGASVFLTLMPGPDNLFVLTESLSKGQRNGLAVSLGLSFGVLFHTLVAATGLSIIIQQSELAFSGIKYLGAFYLLYLAFIEFKDKNRNINLVSGVAVEKSKFSSLVKTGFFMNILNPKVSLFFLAFLPQFVQENGYNITAQMMFLGVVFMMQALIIFGGISFLSGKLSKYLNRPKFWSATKYFKIFVLVALGGTLLLSQR